MGRCCEATPDLFRISESEASSVLFVENPGKKKKNSSGTPSIVPFYNFLVVRSGLRLVQYFRRNPGSLSQSFEVPRGTTLCEYIKGTKSLFENVHIDGCLFSPTHTVIGIPFRSFL